MLKWLVIIALFAIGVGLVWEGLSIVIVLIVGLLQLIAAAAMGMYSLVKKVFRS
jgi:hypothetical protein